MLIQRAAKGLHVYNRSAFPETIKADTKNVLRFFCPHAGLQDASTYVIMLGNFIATPALFSYTYFFGKMLLAKK